MLASASTILIVAEALEAHGRPVTVIDPVMVSTSGTQLLPHKAITELREHLLPLATILTPNISEARLLFENSTGNTYPEPRSLDDLIDLAKKVQALGVEWVLLKGGHLPMTKDHHAAAKDSREPLVVVDVLYNGSELHLMETEYIPSTSTHGTGCSLASAIASGLALGNDMPRAVEVACRYIEKGIKTAIPRGKGNGPINHFHTMPTIPFNV
ncbi:hypothetical protein MMC30_000423 [Trapelia coarctata]|nr:hypothetical protein [Trapelia coarctata]